MYVVPCKYAMDTGQCLLFSWSSALERLTVALQFYFRKHNSLIMSYSKKYYTEKLTLVVKNIKILHGI